MSATKTAKPAKAKPAAADAKKPAASKAKSAPAKTAPAKAKPAAGAAKKPAAAKAASTKRVADAFAAACKAGEFAKAEAFWSDDVVSYEAQEGPMQVARGRAAVHAKGQWWSENHTIHAFQADGPFVNGDHFAMRFSIDVTPKMTGKRIKMDEIAVYTVKKGEVVEERFFY